MNSKTKTDKKTEIPKKPKEEPLQNSTGDSEKLLSVQEKIRLKKEILEVIGVEALKKEVFEEIKGDNSKINEFAKHPAVLLILGFIFTTFVGSWLTWWYQSWEWDRQQDRLAQQRYLDGKKTTAEDVIKAIAETISASDDVLSLFYWNIGDKSNKVEEQKRRDNWEQTSLKWRNNIYILPPKLNTYFKNPEIQPKLNEIIQERNLVGNNLTNMLTDYDEDRNKALNNSGFESDKTETLNKVNKIRDLLGQLTNILIKEIQEEEQKTPQKINHNWFY